MSTITERLKSRIAELGEAIARYQGMHAAAEGNPSRQARVLASLQRFSVELRFLQAMQETDGWHEIDHFTQELHPVYGNVGNLIAKLAGGAVR